MPERVTLKKKAWVAPDLRFFEKKGAEGNYSQEKRNQKGSLLKERPFEPFKNIPEGHRKDEDTDSYTLPHRKSKEDCPEYKIVNEKSEVAPARSEGEAFKEIVHKKEAEGKSDTSVIKGHTCQRKCGVKGEA